MAFAPVEKQGGCAGWRAGLAGLFHPVFKGEARGDRSILSVVAERDRGALEAAIRNAAEGQSEIDPVEAALAGTGERYASLFLTPVEDEKKRDRGTANVFALVTKQQRTIQDQVNQPQQIVT